MMRSCSAGVEKVRPAKPTSRKKAFSVSSAYVKSPEAQKRRGFSAGSFQDMTRVARLDEDRELYEDINYCEKIIEDGSLIRAVEEALGAEIEY